LRVVEGRRLRNYDTRIGYGARQVLIRDDPLGFARGGYGSLQRGLLFGQDAQRDELILDLAQPIEHGLAVESDAAIECGNRLLELSLTRTRIEYGLRQCRAERP